MFRLLNLKKIQFLASFTMHKRPLTHEEAILRHKMFTRDPIQYTFHVKLLKGDKYHGFAESHFNLNASNSDLRLDFSGDAVTRVVVNEKIVDKVDFDGSAITIPNALLKEGPNSLAVAYDTTYNRDGNGCVSFVDVDQKQYLYTQFEPYHANKVFPLFDQPDLKGQMKLNILSPKDWSVLSNEKPTHSGPADTELYLSSSASPFAEDLRTFAHGYDGNHWVYPATKILPSYLFCFIAGEYFELQCPNPYKNIPMSLYCIGSLSEHLKNLAPFMWEVTIESMKFFESYFDFPFSFNKYEQVFVHEYKWGAMENAGIVTFNDIYVWKEKVSNEKMLSLANTVSHELAHHWFGNLVTMKWWNDLWLNQSFADYISHYCLEKIKHNITTLHYESAMVPFNSRKAWGYHEDQLVTTHSIAGSVANAQVAETIFDGITYSKGAATMKQLQFLMTEEKFGRALGEYFNKYQWRNAELKDFMDCMQHHFHHDKFTLLEWQTAWLEMPCHNKIEPFWDAKCAHHNAKLTIEQNVVLQQHPTLRMHAIKVGYFKKDYTPDIQDVILLPVKETTVEYDGSQHYEALLLNYEDYSFVKHLLDPHSTDYFSKNLSHIKDLLSRTLIWRAFYDMLKDAKITAPKYIQIFFNNVEKEENDGLFEKQFDLVNSAINNFTPRFARYDLNDKVFEFIRGLITRTDVTKANRIVVLKSKLIQFAHSPSTKRVLIDWRDNKIEDLVSHPQTIGQQWSTVVKAFTLNDLPLEEKERIYEAQFKIDASDTSKTHRKTIDALRSTPEEFDTLYESYKAEGGESLKQKQHSTSGWNHYFHEERLKNYRERFFKDLPNVSKNLSYDLAVNFLESAQPDLDDVDETLKHYEDVLPHLQDVDYMHLEARKAIDNLKMRSRTYALYNAQHASKL